MSEGVKVLFVRADNAHALLPFQLFQTLVYLVDTLASDLAVHDGHLKVENDGVEVSWWLSWGVAVIELVELYHVLLYELHCLVSI